MAYKRISFTLHLTTVHYSPSLLLLVSSFWHCGLLNLHSHPPSLVPPSKGLLRPSHCGNLAVPDRAAPESENLSVFLSESRYLLCPGVEEVVEVVQSSCQLKDCLGVTPNGSLPSEEGPLLVLGFFWATQFQTCFTTRN